MCISPIVIPNTWFCPHPDGSEGRLRFEKEHPQWFLHDTHSMTIKVPCGVCGPCLQSRQNAFVQRAMAMSKHCYVLFGTLTYSPEMLPSLVVNDRRLSFADVHDFQAFIHRMRKNAILPNFRFLAVTEYGSKGHRPHFHFILFLPHVLKLDGTVDQYKGYEYAQRVMDFITAENGWARNYGDARDPLYKPLSLYIRNRRNYTYDCHFVVGTAEKVCYYVTKYILKFSDYVSRLQSALRLNLDEVQYKEVWSFLRPKLLVSKGFGVKFVDGVFPATEIDDKVDMELSDFINYSMKHGELVPQYYMGNKHFPMCTYYVKRLLKMEQAVQFHNNRNDAGPFADEFNVNDSDNFLAIHQKDIARSDSFTNLQSRLNNRKY